MMYVEWKTPIVKLNLKLHCYSNNYSKTSGRLWQYHRDNPNGVLTNSESLKFKIKLTGKTSAAGSTKDILIIDMLLKYIGNFGRTLFN